MSINKNEITKEMLAKAMQCRTAEELMTLAKSEGCEVTKEEAEAYLAERNFVTMKDPITRENRVKLQAAAIIYAKIMGKLVLVI